MFPNIAINGNYNQASSIVTVVISNLIALALARGVITPNAADALNNQVDAIGAIIIFVLMNGALLIGNQWHRLRYGPTPANIPPATAPVIAAPALNSPMVPSYAPASTGPGDAAPAIPTDIPATAV